LTISRCKQLHGLVFFQTNSADLSGPTISKSV
jgi:hypothetical protein